MRQEERRSVEMSKDKEIKHYIFDCLGTADGYDVGGLHEDVERNINDPDA